MNLAAIQADCAQLMDIAGALEQADSEAIQRISAFIAELAANRTAAMGAGDLSEAARSAINALPGGATSHHADTIRALAARSNASGAMGTAGLSEGDK